MDELRAAVTALSLRPDGAESQSVLVLIDMLRARVVEVLGEFDALGMWELEGATSLTAWLRHHSRMTGRDAQRLSVLARALTQLPAMSEGLKSGALSWGQAEVVITTLGLRLIDSFAEGEALTAELLAPLDMEDTVVLAQRIKAALDEAPLPSEPANSFHLSSSFAGRYLGDLSFDTASGTLLVTALRQAMTPDVEGEEPRSRSQRRADALLHMASFYLAHHQAPPEGRHRPHVNLVYEQGEGVGHVLESGDVLPRSDVEMFLCDANLHRVMRSGSVVLDYGTSTRSISAPLWSALVVRDRHCRFPGCDRPASWCDGHHVVWFSNQGPTNLNNLVLLCRRHHRRLHKPGWSARLDDDANLEVTDPQGRLQVSHPPWWTTTLLA
jgi:hypothetical protein